MKPLFLPILLLVPLTVGCASSGARSVSLPVWQKQVEQYVKENGKGDPAALGRTTLPDGRHGFAMIGDPIVKSSTDASGVLVGYRPFHGKPSFIYLVGLVNDGQVADIRLAAVSFDRDKASWTLSPANKPAVESYLKYKTDLWRRRFPDRKEAPAEYGVFPSTDDAFTLDPATESLTVTHPASGVKWTLAS